MISRHVFVALTGLALAATSPAGAGVLADLNIVECRTHDAAQEQADQALAMKALDVMQAHDMTRLNQMMPDLKAALDHAPDVPSLPEHCGDKVIVYSEQMSDMLTVTALVSAPESGLKNVSVEQRMPLPYPLLAFIIGWIDYENQDYQAAHDAYVKGLKNDPDYHAVIMEDTLTLAALGRSDEGLTQLNAYLDRNPDLPAELKGGALRKRGYVLVELGRWDEAETAYRDSLVAEPGNSVAEGELEYIHKNRPSK